MRDHRLAVEILDEASAMLHDQSMQVIERRLRVAVHMTHDALEDLRLLRRLRPTSSWRRTWRD